MQLDHEAELARAKELVESRLAEYFPGDGLHEAMRYSLLAGGKRVRPVLTLKFCQAAGGTEEAALDFACGVEMLHTYSLIHDDLPCMDNDDLRRGKPTCHKVYGETVAVLAGDALQAAAFATVLGSKGFVRPHIPGLAAQLLAESAGPAGMCLGQYWDTAGKAPQDGLQGLTEIDQRKTGDLLRAACGMGVMAAMGSGAEVDANCIKAAVDYAGSLGIAFQIQDDILDVTSTTEVLGKPVGSDAVNRKSTYVTLLGVEACREQVRQLTQAAKDALAQAGWQGGTDFLCWMADQLALRNN